MVSGSPSLAADSDHLSISSHNKTFIGRLARPAGLLAPTIAIYPPGKNFLSMVFLPLRLFVVPISLLKIGVSRILGSIRSLEKDAPASTVG